MSYLIAAECCCETDLFTLYSCAETPQPAVPRYLFKRCDIYELETGNPRANCPAGWNPNPYIVWLMQRTGCTSPQDKVCGSFVSAGEGSLISPLAMTTDAVNAGYQADYDPDLPVVNTCQYCPGNPCSWILGGPNDILAWLTVDDCCSDDCGNFSRGTRIPCDFREEECNLPLSTPLSYTQLSTVTGGSTSRTGGATGTTTTATMSWGSVPSQWTIVSDPAGADGTYSAKMDVPFLINYSGDFLCGGGQGCGNGSISQSWSTTGTVTVLATALVNTLNCGIGSTLDLIATASVTSTTQSGTAVDLCPTDGPTPCDLTYAGNLSRFSSEDLGCDSLGFSYIRYGSNNYKAFAFRPAISTAPWTGSSCLCDPVSIFGTGTTGSYSYIEIMTPLPDRDFFCS